MTTYAYIDGLMRDVIQPELDRLKALYPSYPHLQRARALWGKRMTRCAGRAVIFGSSSEIILSQHMFRLPKNRDQLLTTLRHEAAHRMAGPGHRHDALWTRLAIEVGGPEAAKVYHHIDAPHNRTMHAVACDKCGADLEMSHVRTKRMLRGMNCGAPMAPA